MLGLKVAIMIILTIFYIIMLSVMIIFERDKPRNTIIWATIFLFTSILGFAIYIVLKSIHYKKRQQLIVKEWEDGVFKNLVHDEIFDNDIEANEDGLFEFNKLAFNSKLTINNQCDIINTHADLKKDILKEIKNSSNYIIFELSRFNRKDFEEIKSALIERAKANVVIKIVHEHSISKRTSRELRRAGVKVYKFSKYNTAGSNFTNYRNLVVIDGRVAYLANFDIKGRQLTGKYDVTDVALKIKGEAVQDIDLSAHEDVIFAGGKYMDYSAPSTTIDNSRDCQVQYISNKLSNDIELVIVKAICMAKKSIQLQLEEFIPTEAILSLLRFAINSHIEVNLMVPMRTNLHSKYYASRAYAKELALFGAKVYLYDGFIRFNAITIDDEYVIFGSFIMDRDHINNALQSMVIVEQNRVVEKFNKIFAEDVKNSYKISNAKLMLLREKFFKNFV